MIAAFTEGPGPPPGVRLHVPPAHELAGSWMRWTAFGSTLTVRSITEEEWARLDEPKPEGFLHGPNGVRCSLGLG